MTQRSPVAGVLDRTAPLGQDRPEDIRLSLLGRWQLRRDGRTVPMPMSGRRLLALLALTGERPRLTVAGTLWPDCSEQRALGNLRSVLWRIQAMRLPLIDVDADTLALGESVVVDVHELRACANGLMDGASAGALGLLLLGEELLPGWYDDWVLLEQERIRQLRLHALERLSDRLLDDGQHTQALEAALSAIAAEPLRESARRAAIRVHLAENNVNEAVRQFVEFRRLLRQELGLAPSSGLANLMRPYLHDTRRQGPGPR
ncbi:MAG: AfsR/SARP family transcriptional regulator [Actinomycetes bacterium]